MKEYRVISRILEFGNVHGDKLNRVGSRRRGARGYSVGILHHYSWASGTGSGIRKSCDRTDALVLDITVLIYQLDINYNDIMHLFDACLDPHAMSSYTIGTRFEVLVDVEGVQEGQNELCAPSR